MDFRCSVHDHLDELGLKGCISYDCFGAGQQVSQVSFSGQNWRTQPSSADLMFEVFLIVRQLHEMCWYLIDALLLNQTMPFREEIKKALYATKRITSLTPHSLMTFNLSGHRVNINSLLNRTSRLARGETNRTDMTADFFGKNLRQKNLKNADLRGACLIAANLEGADLSGADFIGADLRDTNLMGANLSKSIFLTQSQINTAKGDLKTKLPPSLCRPRHWF